MKTYTIGADFGSTGVRLVLVEVSSGEIINSCNIKYRHINMAHILGCKDHFLELQNPDDYFEALCKGINNLIDSVEIAIEDVIAIGIDATMSSPMPVDQNGEPLCNYPEYANDPNAYIKLWKDHTSQNEAGFLNKIIKENDELVTNLSQEGLLAKALHVYTNDPKLYEAMYKYLEVGDWIVWKLTGIETRNTIAATFTYLWEENRGFLYNRSFEKINTSFSNFYKEKYSATMLYPTQVVGTLLPNIARILKLHSNVVVTAANIDAIATIPAAGVFEPGVMISVMGTSGCHMVLSDMGNKQAYDRKARCTLFNDCYTHIYSQVALGDTLSWFINNMIPHCYFIEAESQNISIMELMRIKLQSIDPKENHIIAIDLFNGERSDAKCLGTLAQLSISTKPEEIFLALIESLAFGLRSIIEEHEKLGVEITEIRTCGGVLEHYPFILQIYANVVKKTFRKVVPLQATALGSAIIAASAVPIEKGGHGTLKEAIKKMSHVESYYSIPQEQYSHIYDKRYNSYLRLKEFLKNDTTQG